VNAVIRFIVSAFGKAIRTFPVASLNADTVQGDLRPGHCIKTNVARPVSSTMNTGSHLEHAFHDAHFGYLAISYEEPPASNSSGLNRRKSPEPPKGSFWAA
jgi:hypothetical protein